jgi:hypothetical protein
MPKTIEKSFDISQVDKNNQKDPQETDFDPGKIF